MPSDKNPLAASRPQLRSIPLADETPVRPPPRDESAVVTKQGDEDAGTLEFMVGQCLVGLAQVERKVDAAAKQNEASGVQNQRLAMLVLALVVAYFSEALGQGGTVATMAVVGGVILLAIFPQAGALLVGRVPMLADALAKIPVPKSATSVRPPAGPRQPPTS